MAIAATSPPPNAFDFHVYDHKAGHYLTSQPLQTIQGAREVRDREPEAYRKNVLIYWSTPEEPLPLPIKGAR